MSGKKNLMSSYKKVYPHTHIVRVGYEEYDNTIGYDPEFMYDDDVFVSPRTMSIRGKACGILWLYNGNSKTAGLGLATQGVPKTDLYLGRSDTGRILGVYANHHWDNSEVGGDATSLEWNDPLFTTEDIGKDIPIWLAENPPPPWA